MIWHCPWCPSQPPSSASRMLSAAYGGMGQLDGQLENILQSLFHLLLALLLLLLYTIALKVDAIALAICNTAISSLFSTRITARGA